MCELIDQSCYQNGKTFLIHKQSEREKERERNKTYIFPPKRTEFAVTTAAPHQIRTKTPVNTEEDSSLEVQANRLYEEENKKVSRGKKKEWKSKEGIQRKTVTSV